MDPYAYVGGNPETFSDPSGQRFAPPPGGGGGDGGGAAGGGDASGGAGGHGGSHTGLSNSQQAQLNTSFCPYDPNSNASCFSPQSRMHGPRVVVAGTCGSLGADAVKGVLTAGPSIAGTGILVPSLTTQTTIGSSVGCGEPSGVQTEDSTSCFPNVLERGSAYQPEAPLLHHRTRFPTGRSDQAGDAPPASRRVGVVTGWKVVPGTKTMYNLEVAQDHTFTVGNGQWVVHNSGGLCDDGALRPVNSQGNPYPHIIDLRTEEDVPFPSGTLQMVDPADRVEWDGRYDRAAFIREWYDRGFSEPPGGWDPYDIHHILPKEYGGTNDFWNLTPVDRDFHGQVITPWWNAYVP